MVELRLAKFGDALGVLLPDEVLARLNAKEGVALYLTDGPDGSYLLTPRDPTFTQRMHIADDIIARYPTTLHILAQ